MTAPDEGDDGSAAPAGDGVVRAEYDWASITPAVAVVETVAVASDREPTALESLGETVDTDALNALVRSDGARASEEVSIRFGFAGTDVTVRGGGAVVVRPGEPGPDSER